LSAGSFGLRNDAEVVVTAAISFVVDNFSEGVSFAGRGMSGGHGASALGMTCRRFGNRYGVKRLKEVGEFVHRRW